MSPRNVAGLHAGDFQLDDVFAEQRHHPADRANKFKVVIPPTHVLRKIHRLQNAQQSLGDKA
ncbi:hypothetical protein D3C76_1695980 [compost metagenome]